MRFKHKNIRNKINNKKLEKREKCQRCFKILDPCKTIIFHDEHSFCKHCVHKYLTVHKDKKLTCPHRKCKKFISDTQRFQITGERTYFDFSEKNYKKYGFKKCPGCSILIDKDSGCNEMRCAMCKTKFYWDELKIINNEDRSNRSERETSTFYMDIEPLILLGSILILLIIINECIIAFIKVIE
jgi:hypothetical protein